MRVSTRLAAGSALVLLLLLVVLGYEVAQIRRLADVSLQLARSGIPAAQLALEQIHGLEDMEASARKAYVTGDEDYVRLVARLADGLVRREGDLLSLLDGGQARPEADRLGESLRTLQEEATGLPGTPGEAEFVARIAMARDQARALLEAARRSMADQAAAADEAARRAWRFSVAAAMAAVLTGTVVLALTLRSIQRPLGRLAVATRAVAQGRFEPRLAAEGNDEFTRVSEDFNVMVQRLAELDQMKRDVLSHVSHELKAPLAGMQETIQLLLEDVPGPLTADQRRLLELNMNGARRLFAMIAKMLDLARLEAGVADYDMKPRDVGPLLGEAAAELEMLARERGVSIRVDLPESPVMAKCDGERILQAVVNLVENAVKFSPREGVVVVRAAAAPHVRPAHASARKPPSARPHVLITVSDNGPGVPDDEKTRIFERFHQAGRGRRRAEGGVGLGLAICREIAQAHGASLSVSDRPGGGSVFTMELPGYAGAGGGEP